MFYYKYAYLALVPLDAPDATALVAAILSVSFVVMVKIWKLRQRFSLRAGATDWGAMLNV